MHTCCRTDGVSRDAELASGFDSREINILLHSASAMQNVALDIVWFYLLKLLQGLVRVWNRE